MKCPKCVEGISGTDYYGEAIDCHYCGGTSRFTAAEYCDNVDAVNAHVGDLMVAHALLRQVYERCKRMNPDLRDQIKAFIEPSVLTN